MLKPVMLFVDDEKVILDSLERQLQSEFSTEFSLLFAESGEEGLEILTDCISNQIKIPVVLADYLMPGIKGDQFLINVHQRLPETRKIMLTGQADLEEVTKVINHANLYRYLAKPWEKNDLILTIREAVTSFKQHQMIEAQNKRL